MTLTRSFDRLRTWLAVRLYGLLFGLLTVVVPEPQELDAMLEMLDGERDERFL